MIRTLVTGCVAAVAVQVALVAQAIDFSGTWALDRAASQVVRGAGLTGLAPSGAPDTLHITHAANGTIVVGSEVNESQSRLYRTGGTSAVPFTDGATVQAAARVDRNTLVVEGAAAAGALKEVHTLSDDRQTLTITISSTGATGSNSSTLVYRRATKAAPCHTWPTPCR